MKTHRQGAFAVAEVLPRRLLVTPDGDFLDLDWTTGRSGPVVILFHGLTGSAKSRYARSVMTALHNSGFRVVLMHFRGCSGEPNKTPGSYHSGHTVDIGFLIDTMATRFANTAIAAVGYSLGGNALLKYLATNIKNPLTYAIAVSPPLVLAEGAKRMNSGISKLYQWKLVRAMKAAVREKDKRYPDMQLGNTGYESVRNFWQFDHQVTAPLHGYNSAADYYRKASTLKDLILIKTKTHILFARDDPFFTSACIPTSNDMLSGTVCFELADRGGHVAFIEGHLPLRGKSWGCSRVCELLQQATQ